MSKIPCALDFTGTNAIILTDADVNDLQTLTLSVTRHAEYQRNGWSRHPRRQRHWQCHSQWNGSAIVGNIGQCVGRSIQP
ncbi:MAG: hypothetical protein IPJ48_11590 [Propionivibrio sp.]|uniref:Uncharacterized protein n=1 Tax=Candidatus Propionivibrio dominans TaxID=2954373 RepID=A0A9D7FF65_9RHOO|nr:hypothetical protein [Candidatus Propionivibrio dominans]